MVNYKVTSAFGEVWGGVTALEIIASSCCQCAKAVFTALEFTGHNTTRKEQFSLFHFPSFCILARMRLSDSAMECSALYAMALWHVCSLSGRQPPRLSQAAKEVTAHGFYRVRAWSSNLTTGSYMAVISDQHRRHSFLHMCTLQPWGDVLVTSSLAPNVPFLQLVSAYSAGLCDLAEQKPYLGAILWQFTNSCRLNTACWIHLSASFS